MRSPSTFCPWVKSSLSNRDAPARTAAWRIRLSQNENPKR